MREIKFRGKRINNGEWVYGYLVNSGHQVNPYIEYWWIAKNRYDFGTVFDEKSCDDTFIWHRVDPETIGQYTGLKDKNGVEIYEGDIVKDHYGRIMLVEYAEKFVKFRFKLLYTTGKAWTKNFLYADMYEWFFDEECPEVIGNIYDNPELLEERK